MMNTKTSRKFEATHEISLVDERDGDVRTFEVMLVDGAAYTRAEWDADDKADWTCDDADGAPYAYKHWWFQGGTYPGRSVSVRRV